MARSASRTRAARSTWSGVINFAGFPIPIRAFPIIKSRSAESFKTLAPNGRPVSQVLVDSDGNAVDRDTCAKGIEVGKDQYVALSDEAVESIKAAERTDTLEIERFAPLSTLPLHLATGHYRLIPNEKMPGSAGPVNVLWNGLHASGRGLVTTWVPRSGARDSLLVVHADVYGLNANTLPFASELQDTPEWKPEEDEKAQAMFESFAGMNYPTDDFEHSMFESAYDARRTAAVEAALAGKVVAAPAADEVEKQPVPDLMAAMSAALEQSGGPKKKAARKPAAKSRAKTPA